MMGVPRGRCRGTQSLLSGCEVSLIGTDLRGVQGAKSPAGVWGVPSFFFSSFAACGGEGSIKSSPMEVSPVIIFLGRGSYRGIGMDWEKRTFK